MLLHFNHCKDVCRQYCRKIGFIGRASRNNGLPQQVRERLRSHRGGWDVGSFSDTAEEERVKDKLELLIRSCTEHFPKPDHQLTLSYQPIVFQQSVEVEEQLGDAKTILENFLRRHRFNPRSL